MSGYDNFLSCGPVADRFETTPYSEQLTDGMDRLRQFNGEMLLEPDGNQPFMAAIHTLCNNESLATMCFDIRSAACDVGIGERGLSEGIVDLCEQAGLGIAPEQAPEAPSITRKSTLS